MSQPCPSCLPLDCDLRNDWDLYSIESPLYPFVLNCPVGFDCGSSDNLQMLCCGQLLSVQFPPNATVEERAVITQSLINQCGVRQLYCGDLPQLPPGTPIQLYYNRPQQCSVLCPDGSRFTFSVAAGTFLGTDQATVDRQAADYACVQAGLRKICLGAIASCLCVGTPYTATIPHTGGIAPFVWTAGAVMPPGISLNASTGVLSGTPTTPGEYSFAITVTCADGGFTTKLYSMTVIQITTSSITGFKIGTPYSFQMQAVGGSSPYTWSIVSGSLPSGLTMSDSGLISGTPTALATDPIVFMVTDSTGCHCSKSVELGLITLAVTPLTWNVGDTISYIGTAPSFPGDLFQIDWTASDWDGRGSSATGHFNDTGGQFDGAGNGTMVSLRLMSRMFTGGNGLKYWGAGPCTLKIEDTDQSPSVFSNTLNRTVVRHAAVSIDGTTLAYILAHPDPIEPYTPTGTLTEEFLEAPSLTAQYEDTGTAVGAPNQTIGAPKGILYSPNGVDLVIAYDIAQGGGHAMLTYQKLATSISSPTGVYTLLNDPNGDAPATCTIT